jgi:hypothetical protein
MSLDRKLGLGIGVFLLVLGAIPILVGTGLVSVDPARIFAPGWVIVIAGLVFFLPGVMCVTGRFPFLTVVTFGLFAALPAWIAFGPGAREFSGGIAIGPFALEGRGLEIAGRVFFGIWAVLLVGAFLRLCYDLTGEKLAKAR